MTKKSERELERALERMEQARGVDDDDESFDPIGYLPSGVAPGEEYDYLLTSEGERLPPDTNVCAVLPYPGHDAWDYEVGR